MNIYDETERTMEICSCTRCGYQFPESATKRVGTHLGVGGFMKDEVSLVFYRCKWNDEPILPGQALTLPHLPIVLVLSDNNNCNNEWDAWVHGCTNGVSCLVCSQVLRSRQIMFAHVRGNGYEAPYRFQFDEYFYAHAECSGQLIPRVAALYQQKQKGFLEKNRPPKRWGWW